MCLELMRRRNQINNQKAKVKWLSERDQNTKFFHSLLNYHRSKSSIDKLELMDGSITSDSDEM